MIATTLIVLVFFGVALLAAPRRWVGLPLLMGACYLPYYANLEVGPLHFNAMRVLIAVAAVRMCLRREWSLRPFNPVDFAVAIWATWLIASSALHTEAGTLIFRLGLAYDAVGIYLLFRALCRSAEDLARTCKLTALVLLPLAVEMVYEVQTVHNAFAFLGGADPIPMLRNGHVRASGPFGHPILAGTIGGVCLPLMAAVYPTSRRSALIGGAACVAIILASASSGPILTAAAGMTAVALWRLRASVRRLQIMALGAYVLLDLVMKDPAYFLIARIDLAGGSTSWYRARLIQAAFEHLSEWWLAGTDYTAHWMWVVVSWSPNHTDITSHYIQMGVYGGLPLLLMFGLVLTKSFAGVRVATSEDSPLPPGARFLVWAVGCSLCAHAFTMLSVSYFDQSFVFLYLPIAAVGAIWSSVEALSPLRAQTQARPARVSANRPQPRTVRGRTWSAPDQPTTARVVDPRPPRVGREDLRVTRAAASLRWTRRRGAVGAGQQPGGQRIETMTEDE